MTRLILCTSGKGGVGKTTLVSNLAYALTELGEDVIAVDANLTTPNLGLHLGMQLSPNTLHDVLKGNSDLKDTTYPHPYGFKIIPASMNVNDLTGTDVSKLPQVTLGLLGKADYIIMDCAAGLGREAVTAIQAADEVLLITNPDLASVADALKTSKLAENLDKKVLGVAVNRIKSKWHELTKWEIEEMLNYPVIAEIPEDSNIPKSISIKSPIVDSYPYSPASVEIRRLAHQLVGKPFKYPRLKPQGFLNRLIDWLTR